MRLVEDDHRDSMVVSNGLRGLFTLLRTKNIIVEQAAGDWHWNRLSTKRHMFVNLWHGIPVKRIGLTYHEIERKPFMKSFSYFKYISSSSIDRAMMAVAFGVDYNNVLCTGYPRNDWLSNSVVLKGRLKELKERIESMLKGRRLVLYAPTFRGSHLQGDDLHKGVYDFSEEERLSLIETLKRHNAVFGIRPHLNKTAYGSIQYDEHIIDLSREVVSEVQILLRYADILISDYSGIWVDYLLRDKPIIGFAHDRETYRNDRGFLYDYEKIFPGPILVTGRDLICSLDILLEGEENPDYSEKRKFTRDIFHALPEGGASERIYESLKEQH